MGEVLIRSEAMSIEAFAFRTVETMASCAEVCVWGYTRCTLTPLGMILLTNTLIQVGKYFSLLYMFYFLIFFIKKNFVNIIFLILN